MNDKNVNLWKIKDFSCQNMCFLYFVASNLGQQSLEPKYKENLRRIHNVWRLQTIRIKHPNEKRFFALGKIIIRCSVKNKQFSLKCVWKTGIL